MLTVAFFIHYFELVTLSCQKQTLKKIRGYQGNFMEQNEQHFLDELFT